jgi:hypothetical protein
LDPDYPASLWHLGVTYAEKAMFPEAVASHEHALAVSRRNPAFLGSLVNVQARASHRSEALSLLAELTERAQKEYVTPAAFVFAYAGLGDKERAFEWMERAARERVNMMIFLAVYPPLDPLRSDPRFAEMLRRTGLPSSS